MILPMGREVLERGDTEQEKEKEKEKEKEGEGEEEENTYDGDGEAEQSPSNKYEARTEAVEGGDVEPEWADPLVHKNHLILELTDPNAHSIDMQVWNENTLTDDLIGSIELKVGRYHRCVCVASGKK